MDSATARNFHNIYLRLLCVRHVCARALIYFDKFCRRIGNVCNQSNNLGSNVWSGDRENVPAAPSSGVRTGASGSQTAYCRNGMSHAQFARSHTKRAPCVCFIKCYVNAITLASGHGHTHSHWRAHTQKNHRQFQFSYQDHIDNFSKTCLIYKMCACVSVCVCCSRTETERKRCHHSLCACARLRREELFIFARSLYMCGVCVFARGPLCVG